MSTVRTTDSVASSTRVVVLAGGEQRKKVNALKGIGERRAVMPVIPSYQGTPFGVYNVGGGTRISAFGKSYSPAQIAYEAEQRAFRSSPELQARFPQWGSQSAGSGGVISSTRLQSPSRTSSRDIEVIDTRGKKYIVSAIPGIKREIDGTVRLDKQTGAVRRLLQKEINQRRDEIMAEAIRPAEDRLKLQELQEKLKAPERRDAAERRAEEDLARKQELARVAAERESRLQDKMEKEVDVFYDKQLIKSTFKSKDVQQRHENRIKEIETVWGLKRQAALEKYKQNEEQKLREAEFKRDIEAMEQSKEALEDIYKLQETGLKEQMRIVNNEIQSTQKSIALSPQDRAVEIDRLKNTFLQYQKELEELRANRIAELQQGLTSKKPYTGAMARIFNTPEEAINSGLPAGTRVIVAGQEFILQE